MKVLQVSVTVPEGQEVAAARDLMAKVPEAVRGVLVALACEIVSEHEYAGGSRVILAPVDRVDRVFRDLVAK
jgi:hypothetical protein